MNKDFHIRLAFTMGNETPGDAVQDVVDLFTEKGFRDWVYVVDDAVSGERLGYFNGWGEQLSTETVEAAAAAARRTPDANVQAEPVVPASFDDDDEYAPMADEPFHDDLDDQNDHELEQLAETLNAENDQPVPSNEELLDQSIRQE